MYDLFIYGEPFMSYLVAIVVPDPSFIKSLMLENGITDRNSISKNLNIK